MRPKWTFAVVSTDTMIDGFHLPLIARKAAPSPQLARSITTPITHLPKRTFLIASRFSEVWRISLSRRRNGGRQAG